MGVTYPGDYPSRYATERTIETKIEETKLLEAETREELYELIGAERAEADRSNDWYSENNSDSETVYFARFSDIYEIASQEPISDERIHATEAYQPILKKRAEKAAQEAAAKAARSEAAKLAAAQRKLNKEAAAIAKAAAERAEYERLRAKFGGEQ